MREKTRTGEGAGIGAIHLGTSGWHYEHWVGPFYPDDLRPRDFLRHYCDHFHTVEINNSFYQLPSEKTLKDWRDTSPSEFIFTAKASRFITHMKKLLDPDETLPPFLQRIRVLGGKLGPILFQLPPNWKFNGKRLADFLEALPKDLRYAMEFRDQSWIKPETYGTLADRGVAFCMYDLAGYQSPREVTADFVYIRLHGPEGAYQGQYHQKTLQSWAKDITAWAEDRQEVFCYFDNDEKGYAAQDALRLQEMINKG
ncbi:MAG: DUF72 domain-containing protein [Deltaproteobacteria bacterium]|nr:DUF72 domain-containing protein [Deltaproteobacteria bacterium]